MAKITHIQGLEILDSRGVPTVQVHLSTDDDITAIASVPSGASTGEHEALELRDKDPRRYNGKGVLKAVEHVNTTLQKLLIGQDVSDQEKIDQMMIECDGTPSKSKLGANAILGVSMAACKASAQSIDLPLYDSIAKGNKTSLPCPMLNILNGGAHADNSLEFQEFLIRPHAAPSFREALRWSAEVFFSLKSLLKQKKYATAVGDEGGFAPNLQSHEEALELISKAIEQAGFHVGGEISLAIDCAASELFDTATKRYIEKKRPNGKSRSSDEQIEYLETLCKTFAIDSIEDGLSEHDWEGWQKLTKKLGKAVQLIGDDIFVTNPIFLQKGIDMGVANSILIKVNQIGTLTETLQTISLAQKHGYVPVISHRSGETDDSFIADLAVATNAGQIKTGAPCRGERVAKYNRLLQIEQELNNAPFFDSNQYSKRPE
jgi:enolase